MRSVRLNPLTSILISTSHIPKIAKLIRMQHYISHFPKRKNKNKEKHKHLYNDSNDVPALGNVCVSKNRKEDLELSLRLRLSASKGVYQECRGIIVPQTANVLFRSTEMEKEKQKKRANYLPLPPSSTIQQGTPFLVPKVRRRRVINAHIAFIFPISNPTSSVLTLSPSGPLLPPPTNPQIPIPATNHATTTNGIMSARPASSTLHWCA